MKLSALCVIALFGVSLLSGCATEVPEGVPGVVEYGEEATAVTQALELTARDEVALLERQMSDVVDQRDKLRKDASKYRKLSSEAWTDTRLTDLQRGPEAKQYLQLAQNLEAEAEAYSERARAIDSRISELEAKRHKFQRRLELLEDQEDPAR